MKKKLNGVLALVLSAAAVLPLSHATWAATGPTKASAAKPAQGYAIEPATPAWTEEWPAAELQNPVVAASPLQVLLADDQAKLDEKGGEEHFRRIIRRIQEPAGLEQGAQWAIDFDPSYQRLVLHRLIVWRNGQKLDRLRSTPVKLLQRETQLERQMVDGRLTASLVLEDIRVGDRIELAYSLRGANPVFGGRYVDQDWSLSTKGPMALFRSRLLAPASRELHYRADPQRHEVSDQLGKGWRDLQIRRRNAPALNWEVADQPPVEWLPDMLEFSEFANWADVGRWAEQLFGVVKSGSESPEVMAQAQALKGDTPAASIAAVLDFVQKEVRYFGTEIGANTHQPAAPATVLRQRLGDCKDKVALMAALLRAQGIASQPLLVSTSWQDLAAGMLPSPLAFNHAVIRVLPEGGEPLVLDATRSLQAGPLSERLSLGLGRGLPAVADAAPLATPTARGALRLEVQETLSFARLSEDPVLETRWRYWGDHAEALRAMTAGENRSQVEKEMRSDYARQYTGAEPLGDMAVAEVEGHNALDLTLRLRLPRHLRLVDDRQLTGELGAVALAPALRLPDQAPRTRGLRLSTLGVYRETTVVQYPEDVFSVQPAGPRKEEGDRFTTLRYSHQLSPRRAELRYELEVKEQDLPAAEWAAHRDTLVKLWPKLTNTLSIGLASADKADQMKASLLRLAEDARRGKLKLATETQAKATGLLVGYDAVLAGDRLPPAARARLLSQRGIQLDILGRFDEARPSFEQAMALAPDEVEYITAAAVNAAGRRDDAQALALAERGLRLQPSDEALHMVRAQALYHAGQLDAARSDVQEVLQSARGEQAGYARLWLALITRSQGGDAQKATDAIRAATPPGGEPADASWPQPILQALLGERSEAEARKAAVAPENQRLGRLCELDFFLGEWHWLGGDRDQARRLFRQSVETGVTEYVEYGLARRRLDSGG